QRSYRGPEWRRIALHRPVEAEAVAHRLDCHTMRTEVAADDHGVTGADALGRRGRVLDDSNAGGGDEQPVALAAFHDFRVAGDDRHARLACRVAHCRDDGPEVADR